MEREFETKGLITKADFEMLTENLKVLAIREQSNTYLDTNEGFFKKDSSALRLRIIDGQYIFSLKRQDVDGASEWNQTLTASQYDEIIKSQAIDLSLFDCPHNDYLSNLNIVSINTTRYVCKYHEHTIELDATTFNTTIDYELEIEAESLTTASQIMSQITHEYNLDIKKSYPKIARYFMYN